MNPVSNHTTRRLFRRVAIAAALIAAPFATVHAQITDGANDWLPSYTGPRNPLLNGDLDILQAQVFFDGRAFTFTSRSAGNIGSTTGGFFVWGMNRGAGTARFATLAPGVLFDWVLVITPGGTVTTRDLVTGTATTIDASSVTFSGANITAVIPATLLPGQGFSLADFTANLWSRMPGGNEGLADFAPDNRNFAVTVTPEPESLLLVGTGLFALIVWRRRRA